MNLWIFYNYKLKTSSAHEMAQYEIHDSVIPSNRWQYWRKNDGLVSHLVLTQTPYAMFFYIFYQLQNFLVCNCNTYSWNKQLFTFAYNIIKFYIYF